MRLRMFGFIVVVAIFMTTVALPQLIPWLITAPQLFVKLPINGRKTWRKSGDSATSNQKGKVTHQTPSPSPAPTPEKEAPPVTPTPAAQNMTDYNKPRKVAPMKPLVTTSNSPATTPNPVSQCPAHTMRDTHPPSAQTKSLQVVNQRAIIPKLSRLYADPIPRW